MKHRSGFLTAALAGAVFSLCLPGLSSAAVNKTVAKQLESYVNDNGLACMACHGIEDTKVGPSWIDVSKKFATDPKAVATLTDRIAHGGTGTWGSTPMPPNMANAEQSAHLAKLITKLYTK